MTLVKVTLPIIRIQKRSIDVIYHPFNNVLQVATSYRQHPKANQNLIVSFMRSTYMCCGISSAKNFDKLSVQVYLSFYSKTLFIVDDVL